MNARLIPIAAVLFAFSSTTVQAQGKGGPHHKTQEEIKVAHEYFQCVYNQGGYVLQVNWFASGTMKSTKNGSSYTISATKPAMKTETITLGQKSCVGGAKTETKHSAVLTVKGGKIARTVAIVAADVGAVAGTGACWVGVAALTAVTAGGGAVAGVGCETVTDAAIGLIADPSVIPDAKDLFAVVQPPSSNSAKGNKPLMIVTYGTVFDPKTKTGRP